MPAVTLPDHSLSLERELVRADLGRAGLVNRTELVRADVGLGDATVIEFERAELLLA